MKPCQMALMLSKNIDDALAWVNELIGSISNATD